MGKSQGIRSQITTVPKKYVQRSGPPCSCRESWAGQQYWVLCPDEQEQRGLSPGGASLHTCSSSHGRALPCSARAPGAVQQHDCCWRGGSDLAEWETALSRSWVWLAASCSTLSPSSPGHVSPPRCSHQALRQGSATCPAASRAAGTVKITAPALSLLYRQGRRREHQVVMEI